MFVKLKKTWILGTLALLLMAGCDRGAKAPESADSDSDSGAVSVAESDLNGRAAGSSFTVAILPEAPRAKDVLRTVVRGMSGPFDFSWQKNGKPIPGQDKTLLRPLGQVRGDVIRVVVAAQGRETSAEVVIRNSPPKVLSVVSKTPAVFRGEDLVVEPVAEDADGDPVEFSYVWRVNERALFGEDGPVLPGDSFHRGDNVEVVVTPRDGVEEGEPFDGRMKSKVGNAPPMIVSTSPTTVTSLEYRYQVQAVDADEDEISFELAAGPDGMAIDPATGLVSWSIPEDAAGTFEVKIEARDSGGGLSYQEYSLEIKSGE